MINFEVNSQPLQREMDIEISDLHVQTWKNKFRIVNCRKQR